MFHNRIIDGTQFAEIVGDIYDCVLEPSRWADTLARIASAMQSVGSSVIISDASDARGGLVFEHGADQKYLRLFFQRHAVAGPHQSAEQRSIGVPTTLNGLCSQEPHAQAFYATFIKPQGFSDLIAIQLLRSGRRVGWLSTARSGLQPRYVEWERQLMSALSPHLCQALALSDAIDLQSLTADRLEQTVDALSAGVFLTERSGRIVYMNKAAQRQLNTGNALQLVDRRLVATRNESTLALARALAARTCTEAAAGPAGTVLALPDGDGSGYLASVLPLDGGARAELMARYRAAAGVFVQEPQAASPRLGEAFARLYGLTPAELKVLLALSPGLTAKEAARELGVREPTIKTHLQRIYVKTGMSRQSELVRLLLAHRPPLREF
jgi:DNA-binding CsgD family transcriptional regulator